MIFPSIDQLTGGKFNRYALVIATAKVARIITDEQNERREEMEKTSPALGTKEYSVLDKTRQKDVPDVKPVSAAINKIHESNYTVVV
ncbi:hypothetical protein FACS1894105_05220 [Clostridia bacterium]|nr:hypothetical protein FACS1894105_05220 [Clostridia bacterium]GHV10786.1 hypothetical protein FACS1894219_00880 [Clostridia bacterium]